MKHLNRAAELAASCFNGVMLLLRHCPLCTQCCIRHCTNMTNLSCALSGQGSTVLLYIARTQRCLSFIVQAQQCCAVSLSRRARCVAVPFQMVEQSKRYIPEAVSMLQALLVSALPPDVLAQTPAAIEVRSRLSPSDLRQRERCSLFGIPGSHSGPPSGRPRTDASSH